MESITKDFDPVHKSIENKGSCWKTVSARIRRTDIMILNQRLHLFGYTTLNELVGDFINGKFPHITEDRQIENLNHNNQKNGQKTILYSYNPDFLERVDIEDMLRYYVEVRRLHPKTAKCLVSYFKRYRETFFGNNVEEIRGFLPNKRMWILDAFKKFGTYYQYKTGNEECTELILRIIRRYGLNIGNSDHGRLYIVDESHIEEKIDKILKIEGEIGITIKIGLFSGLREDEILYIHKKEICENPSGCKCDKLHVVNKAIGITVVLINWYRGHKKSYFTLFPTSLWNEFRSRRNFDRTDIEIAHKILLRNAEIMYMYLRKLHYNIMCRKMQQHEADVLAGRAKSVAAQHYILYELDKMSEDYMEAWKMFKVQI